MNRAEAIPVDGSRSTTEAAGDPPAAPSRPSPRVRPPTPAPDAPAGSADPGGGSGTALVRIRAGRHQPGLQDGWTGPLRRLVGL